MCNERFGWSSEKGYYGKSQMTPGFKTQPSELEMRIREEILFAVGNIWNTLDNTIKGHPINIVKDMEVIKDRLTLLWGIKPFPRGHENGG